MKQIQQILSHVRHSIEKYNMIQPGDKIAVGVSAGKDSLTLLCALAELRRFLPAQFELHAITIDMGFPGADFSQVQSFCDRLNVPYHIKKTEISKVIFDIRKEKNPCSLCARMRRGALHDATIEIGCNKIALGHHYDDVIETFMLNLFFEGRIGAFNPVTYLSRKDITMIRPLISTPEKEIKHLVNTFPMPIVTSPCPANGKTEREYMKQYLESFDKKHGGLYKRIMNAIEKAGVDGYRL